MATSESDTRLEKLESELEQLRIQETAFQGNFQTN